MDKGVLVFFVVLVFGIIGVFVSLILFFNLDWDFNKIVVEDKTECDLLKEAYDEKINYFDAVECNKVELFEIENVYVGGTLLNTSWEYDKVLKRYEHRMKFVGDEIEGWIFILSEREQIPYEVGKFYKFDLIRKCDFLKSSTDIGFYNDEGFKELVEMRC